MAKAKQASLLPKLRSSQLSLSALRASIGALADVILAAVELLWRPSWWLLLLGSLLLVVVVLAIVVVGECSLAAVIVRANVAVTAVFWTNVRVSALVGCHNF